MHVRANLETGSLNSALKIARLHPQPFLQSISVSRTAKKFLDQHLWSTADSVMWLFSPACHPTSLKPTKAYLEGLSLVCELYHTTIELIYMHGSHLMVVWEGNSALTVQQPGPRENEK